MIEDRYINKSELIHLNDHLEIFRLYERISESINPLMFIQLVCKETTDNMLESKFVKYMSYEPDLLTIKSSLMKYIDLIKSLSELLDKVDSNELKLRESKPVKLIVLFESEDDYKNMITYPWFKTA